MLIDFKSITCKNTEDAPFHFKVDVDQKLLFSMARAALFCSLSLTVTATVKTIMLILICWKHFQRSTSSTAFTVTSTWKSMEFTRLPLTFLSLCHCSEGSGHLRGGNQIHYTPSKLSNRTKERKNFYDNILL